MLNALGKIWPFRRRTTATPKRVVTARWDAAQTTSENRKHWAAADNLSAAAALQAAISAADPTDRIVVFGSFYTVGGVLKDGVPRLQARHLSP